MKKYIKITLLITLCALVLFSCKKMPANYNETSTNAPTNEIDSGNTDDISVQNTLTNISKSKTQLDTTSSEPIASTDIIQENKDLLKFLQLFSKEKLKFEAIEKEIETINLSEFDMVIKSDQYYIIDSDLNRIEVSGSLQKKITELISLINKSSPEYSVKIMMSKSGTKRRFSIYMENHEDFAEYVFFLDGYFFKKTLVPIKEQKLSDGWYLYTCS